MTLIPNTNLFTQNPILRSIYPGIQSNLYELVKVISTQVSPSSYLDYAQNCVVVPSKNIRIYLNGDIRGM